VTFFYFALFTKVFQTNTVSSVGYHFDAHSDHIHFSCLARFPKK